MRRHLEVRRDAAAHRSSDALAVDGSDPLARCARDVEDAGSPLRIVLVIRDEREDLRARPVDDDAVLRSRHGTPRHVQGLTLDMSGRAYPATSARARNRRGPATALALSPRGPVGRARAAV